MAPTLDDPTPKCRPSDSSSCPNDVLRRLATHSEVPTSQLSTLLVTNLTTSLYLALLDYAALSSADPSPTDGISANDDLACSPISLYVPAENPLEQDDALSDDDGAGDAGSGAGQGERKSRTAVSRGPRLPNMTFGLGETTVMWPPPPHLAAEHLYNLRRAKALGLSRPSPSRGGTKGRSTHFTDNAGKNSVASGAGITQSEETGIMHLHVSHFRIGDPVSTTFETRQVHGVVIAVALPHRSAALRTFADGVVKWQNSRLRRLDGSDRYTVMRFRITSRCSRWEVEGMRRSRPCASVVLRPGVMDALLSDTGSFLSTKAVAWYRTHGLPHRRTFLFHGPPGTGKTSTAKVLASEFRLTCCVLNVTDKKFSNQALHDAIGKLKPHSLLLIEDVDALFHKREEDKKGEGGSGQAAVMAGHELTFSGLLNALDGVLSADHVVTVLTTNYKDRLDEALIRAGRVDRQFLFDFPDEKDIKTLFERFYPDCVDEGVKEKFVQKVMKRSENGAKSVATLQQLFIMNRERSAEVCAENVDTWFETFFGNGSANTKASNGIYT